jgi:cytochrome c peroxidase
VIAQDQLPGRIQASEGQEILNRDLSDRMIGGIERFDFLEPMAEPPLWTPSAPIQNPYSEAKRVLGKILFWDEQLSSDSTISCGTCHIPSSGGADPRPGQHPGFDEIFNTPDDVLGSLGVISMDAMDQYDPSDLFGLETQVTPRVSQSNLMGMFAGSLFWDGRAELNFVDPETGVLMFQSGVAGLEIQASGPIMNPAEMGHAGRTWDQVREKLQNARPMAMGDSIPADMLAAIELNPTYGELFEEAFGDPMIDAVRISFALGTYQRTLIPDQTPWDLWNAGDDDAMTANQIAGLGLYQASSCGFCHAAPTFSNFDLMVDGVRPPFEDTGRQGVTGLFSDRGKFKTPSIRNMALRNRLMHTGGLSDIDDIFDFYGHRNGLVPFGDNLHFLLNSPILFSQAGEIAVKDFLVNALTDPRLANETFPFDRPSLNSELATPNPQVIGSGQSGSGGFVPAMIAVIPPYLGNETFKVGVDGALGGSQAWVAISENPPVNGELAHDELVGPIVLSGMGNGGGYGTFAYPIANNPGLDGKRIYMQWVIDDPAGDLGKGDGFVRSPVAQIDIFCSAQVPCTIACAADFNGDGLSDFADISLFVGMFTSGSALADLNHDGSFDFVDISEFVQSFGNGCP